MPSSHNERTPLRGSYSRLGGTSKKEDVDYSFGFDLQFLRRVRRLYSICLPPLWSADSFMIALLLLGVFPPLVTQFLFAVMPGWILKTLIEREPPMFMRAMATAGGVAVLDSLLSGLNFFLSLYVCVRFRKRLTEHLHERYVSVKDIFYHLSATDSRIDNPDQRIQNDAAQVTIGMVTILAILMQALLQITFYTCYVTIKVGWHGTALVYAYYLFTFLVNRSLMSPIVALTYNQDRLEGNFRYNHAQLRSCAESIAFSAGEEEVKHRLATDLLRVLNNQKKNIIWQSYLNLFTTVVQNGNALLGYFVAALTIFNNPVYGTLSQATLGELVTQLTSVIGNLTGAFTTLISIAPMLAELAGNTSRVGKMLEVIDELEGSHDEYQQSGSVSFEGLQPTPGKSTIVLLKLDNISCSLPNGQPIVQGLHLQVCMGKSLLIRGPSGCGKTSLLRYIRGLWQLAPSSGTVHCPLRLGSGGVIFCPQDPFLVPGTLQEQITFPRFGPHLPAESWELEPNMEINAAMTALGLGDVVRHGWSGTRDWNSELSLGEKQRVGIVRLLFQKPALAFLDESTSALSVDMEESCYKMLKAANITVVSIAHRPSTARFHDQALELSAVRGEWTLQPLHSESVTAS